MTETWTGLATRATQPDSWFRTTSPDVAIHIAETSFYPHRLRLLGHSNSFGLTGCVTCVGPITVADITYKADVALDFDETRSNKHLHYQYPSSLRAPFLGAHDRERTPHAAPTNKEGGGLPPPRVRFWLRTGARPRGATSHRSMMFRRCRTRPIMLSTSLLRNKFVACSHRFRTIIAGFWICGSCRVVRSTSRQLKWV